MNMVLGVFSFVLALMAVCVVLTNWHTVVFSMLARSRGKECNRSSIPLVSLVFCAIAFQASSWEYKKWLWFIPLLDIANWMLVLLPFALIRDAVKKFMHKSDGSGRG